MRRLVVVPLLGLVALFGVECATPTALTVTVYSEVACGKGSAAALVGGASLAALSQRAPSSVSTKCDADGANVRMGSVVLVPSGAKDETVAFAVMQRADGQPADGCLDPAQASGCIVAKRQLRFERHSASEMRVDLRLSCLGVPCSAEQTCVQGTCVEARTTCGASCDERTLSPGDDGGVPDASAPDASLPDAPPPDAAATARTGLLGLTLSAGALSPAFDPATRSYAVVPSVVSLGVPFTVTPTYASDSSVTINGAAVPSGAPSPVLVQNLLSPTPIDVTVTSAVGAKVHYALVAPPVQEAYAKASNPRLNAYFGTSVALSGDTLAVGSYGESSAATGINGNPADASAGNAGAVYVYTRSGATWLQQAYVKASNTRPSAIFGYSIALSGDTLAVGSYQESSGATGVNGSQADTSAPNSGAVYVFTRSGTTWAQQAYVKASNTRPGALFGVAVALSGDTLAVGSYNESSNATGINGNQADTSSASAGAVYVFTRSGAAWSQQAYVKASNTRAVASFGSSVALSGDTLAVGSSNESSGATGIDGNQLDTSGPGAGAVYVFTRSVAAWSQQAYVKATNTRPSAQFGFSVALSGDTLAVGASGEASNATGVNGNPGDTSAPNAGAAYVFTRSGTTWSRQAYIKASTTRMDANFGYAMALVGDALAVGSYGEASNAIGINGSQADTSAPNAGAAYVFRRSGATWAQQAYVKASNPRGSALFGSSVALSGDTLAVGSYNESSGATGINGDPANPFTAAAGAVYVLR